LGEIVSKKHKQKQTVKQRELPIIIGIFIVALSVRFLFLQQSSSNPTFAVPIVDSESYHFRALDLVAGKGFTDVLFWQPLFYQLYLCLAYITSESSILFAKIVQVLLGAVTCTLTYHLGRIVFDRSIGIAAGIITALYGTLIFFEAELLATGWTAFWSVTLILLFLYVRDGKRPAFCWILGVCGALSVITRPTFLPFFLAGCLWLATIFIRSQRKWRLLAHKMLPVATGFLLVALPVSLLNLSVTGHFGFLPASGGINFYIGNNPNLEETLSIRTGKEWDNLTRLPAQHGVEGVWNGQKFFYGKVWDYASSDPAAFGKGLGRKAAQFVSSREIPRNVDIYLFRDWSVLLSVLTWKVGGWGFPFGLLLPLSAAGLIYYRRKIPLPLTLFVILYPLSIILVFVSARYRVPMVPVLAVLAAAGAGAVIKEFQPANWRNKLLVAAGTISMVLLMTIPGPFPEENINYEAELYYGVGCTQERMGRKREAVSNFSKAIELRPDYAEAHNNLGNALANTGNHARALNHLSQALQIKPNYAEAHYNVGVTLMKMKRTGEALPHFQQAVKLMPDFGKAHFNLGIALIQTGRDAEAMNHLREAAALMPNSSEAHFSLGHLLTKQGNFDAAMEEYRQALNLARSANQTGLAQQIENRLEKLQGGRP
jgi:Flp pilus assembly protein TadD